MFDQTFLLYIKNKTKKQKKQKSTEYSKNIKATPGFYNHIKKGVEPQSPTDVKSFSEQVCFWVLSQVEQLRVYAVAPQSLTEADMSSSARPVLRNGHVCKKIKIKT